MNGAIYVSNSGNSKISGSNKVDATYTSIQATCPNTCALKNEACYAELSFTGIQSKRLNREAEGMTPLQVARSEAKAIDNAYQGGPIPANRDMRVHVAGDSRTVTGTRIINKAVGRWKKRGGGDCWSYTHAWKSVHRKEWSNISILASIDNVDDAKLARKQGYAPAIVVAEFKDSKAFNIKGSKVKWIPCPAQTKPGGKEVSCVDCRLCFKSDYLYQANCGIAFAAHGIKKNNIKRRLNVIK